MKHRFMSVGQGCHIGNIEITYQGFETEDEDVVKFLLGNPLFGDFFYEVPTREDLLSFVDKNEGHEYAEPTPVEKLEMPDLDVEIAALKKEEEAQKADAEFEEDALKLKDVVNEEIDKRTGRKHKPQNKSATAKKPAAKKVAK